ncbi:MAG: 50S ribosome-binding GTPase [Clostridium sp.]|nr:50S ribosome-binding GTPase [Clostridium sp.]
MKVENLKGLSKKITNEELKDSIKELIGMIEAHGNKVKIINAGLLKAGKSSLFNALTGNENFETDVIRATVLNKSVELDEYILIDTPGLDANYEDDNTAFEGYKDADRIIFVHNIVDGELNKIEVDSLKKISEKFKNISQFFESTIMVLSHADQLEEDDIARLKGIIEKQIFSLFNCQFKNIIMADSISYLKGIRENKKLLIEESNIEVLKNAIKEIIKLDINESSFEANVRDEASKISLEVDRLIESSRHSIDMYDEIDTKIQYINKKKSEIESKIKAVIKQLDNDGQIESQRVSNIYLNCNTRSCGYEFKSEYSAKQGGTRECDTALSNAVRVATTEASAIAHSYESNIRPDGKVNSIKNKLLNEYNELKEIYYSIDDKMDGLESFNIQLASDETVRKLEKQIENYKVNIIYIARETFKSLNYYLTNYSTNLDIDYDYRTEYVSGLFGMKEKEVCYYAWDISGALDDIKSDLQDIVSERTSGVLDNTRKLYRYYIDDLSKQYVKLTDSLKTNITKKLNSYKSKQSELKLEKDNAKKNIELLTIVKDELERI